MKKKSAYQSAPARRNPWLAVVFRRRRLGEGGFFKLRLILSVLVCFAAVTIILLAQPRPSSGQSGQQRIIHAQYRGVMRVVKFDISPKPLSDIVPLPVKECTKSENEGEGPIPPGPVGLVLPDKAVQRVLGRIGIPGPIITFDGNSNGCGCSPPDPNGAVGPNHFVTMSNLSYQMFNKAGQTVAGPNANKTLWAGFGGNCEMENAGDPVVLYDQLADRWLFTQFTSSAPYLECVALSQTQSPTGFYYRWAIETGNNFPDYPKVGMWPDAYYFSTRELAGGSTFVGVGAYALDRVQALNGNPNPIVVGFLAPPNPPYAVGDGLLPSDVDGMTPPPVGSPNYFVGTEDNNGPYGAPSDALTIWKFHYDPQTPANSTFTLTNTLPTQPFNSILGLCGGFRACIPQPGTTNRIDHLGYRQRPLFRLAYRNFGSHESLVTNQSVSAGTGPNGEVSGIRWWELRSPGNNPVIFQEGTYAPGLTDGIHRWMASIAMNSLGDIAMSYSASDGTATFPSVYYTARHAGDPPGQMTLGEGSIINGTGSQIGSNKWGDYTSIDVDPVDDQTFWVVNEYIPTTSSVWRLRIGAFNLAPTPTPTLPPATPTPTCSICFTPSPTPTPTASPSPTCSEQYVITQIGGSIVPGTTDIGNHSDDLVTIIPLPFTYQLYHTNMGPIRLSSNGNAQFTTIDSAFDVCLPWLNHGFTVFPYWDDQRTDAQPGCSGFPGGTCGIYTSISGSAPNRIFNIEWRTVYDTSPTQPANYELRLYEGQNRFDVIYGNVALANTTATAGVQFDETSFVQYFCSGSGGRASGGQSYILQPCSMQTPSPTAAATATATAATSPSPTAIATSTPTATASPSATPTLTPRPSPTARPALTPRPRPAPPPRP